MTDQHETLRNQLMRELDEIETNERIQKALNKTLPNDSDETDYEKWSKGCSQFFDDHKDMIMAFIK